MHEISDVPQDKWVRYNPYDIYERQLNEDGGRFSRILDEQFGSDNWVFDTGRFETENSNQRTGVQINNELASEGMRNTMSGTGYRLDDGTDISGRIIRYAAASDKGDIKVAPDIYGGIILSTIDKL